MVYLKTDKKEFIMSNIREEAIILFREIRLSFWKSEITEREFVNRTCKMLVSFLSKPQEARRAAEAVLVLNQKHLPEIENPLNAKPHQRTSAYAPHEHEAIRLLCVTQKAVLDHYLGGG